MMNEPTTRQQRLVVPLEGVIVPKSFWNVGTRKAIMSSVALSLQGN